MITCPNCHKPVSGRPRACGYCGTSLVQEYFQAREEERPPERTAGGVAATVLGTFGAIALLGAAALQLITLFYATDAIGFGVLTPLWWARMLALMILTPAFLVQLLVLRGVRFSLGFDAFWLTVGVFGLGLTVQAYFDKGAVAFYDQPAIAYLLAVGCALMAISCVVSILSYRRAQ